jgi:Holliday junction resolvase
MNSRQKGKRGELEAAAALRAAGYEARRGQQFKGTADSPDVQCSIPFHIEVKLRQNLNLHGAMEQAALEAPGNRTPVVYHRKNRTEPLLTMRFTDWIELVKAVYPPIEYGRNTKNKNGTAI